MYYIIFTCGEHTFRREVAGNEGTTYRCYNCGNYSGHVIKSHPWFTFCFVVSLPVSRMVVAVPSADAAPAAGAPALHSRL